MPMTVRGLEETLGFARLLTPPDPLQPFDPPTSDGLQTKYSSRCFLSLIWRRASLYLTN